MEVALADTTGRADPAQVGSLFETARERFPQVSAWAFHGHDTYGLGAANAFAAWRAGAKAIDSSFAGLGGCPFAPAATGNIPTEDLVYMLHRSGFETGVSLEALIDASKWLQQQLGRPVPGMLVKAGGFPNTARPVTRQT